jgi:hypothetical protein
MLTQQEWVEGCYAYYAENGYEPGNPEDGEWEDAHYPVPKCEGGEVTIKLLKQHHAVQGVLQSEEYQRPCIWGWEANYLEGEMLALCKKWKVINGKLTGGLAGKKRAELSPEERRAISLRSAAARNREANRAAGRLGRARLSPEQRSEISRRGHETRRRNQEAAMLQSVTTP